MCYEILCKCEFVKCQMRGIYYCYVITVIIVIGAVLYCMTDGKELKRSRNRTRKRRAEKEEEKNVIVYCVCL